MARIRRGFRSAAALLCAAAAVAMGAGAPAAPAPFDPGLELFLRANLEFTLFHELGHMAIDELALPVLGMEEDAADRIAVIAMLLSRQDQSAEHVIPWLFAVAGDWYTEWELGDGRRESGEIAYWAQHPLEIQRFHNIVCLVFGSDPETLSGLVDTELLPFPRAMSCEREFRLAQRAVQWVRDTHGPNPARGPGSPIGIRYLPAAPARLALADWVAASGIAEAAAARLAAAVRLPRPIAIEFDDCPANPDAVWRADLQLVSICYQLLEHFLAVGRYRIAHREPACAIPEVRNWLGGLLACPP
ncbi:MAG: DUF4344 domain-containing metallopeptidase [Pseudomonadota bacterium]